MIVGSHHGDERPATVDELDRLAREESQDDWGLWLPGSRSIVLFGDLPLPWQREEHDAILATLVGEQAIRDAGERERRLTYLARVLGEAGIALPPDEVEVQRLVHEDPNLALRYSLAGLFDPVDDLRDDAHSEDGA